MELQLHPVTARQLSLLTTNLPQSLLLSGPSGVGLRCIAAFIAAKELTATIQPRNAKGDIDLKTGVISVEIIRQLYDQTRTKQEHRRIIIIDNADRMSRGAQAAFLKLLEEPNTATHFILTAHEPQILLPTIRSRLQQLTVQPITPEQTIAFIKARSSDERKLAQLQFIAPGLPAEIVRLLADRAYFEARAKIITDARIFLQEDLYPKMRLIHAYRSSREDTLSLLDGAMSIVKHTLQAKPQVSLIQQLGNLLEVKEQIASNQSIPLNLARIVL